MVVKKCDYVYKRKAKLDVGKQNDILNVAIGGDDV